MKFSNILFFLICMMSVVRISAQDIHWSMFNMAPISLNPASSGDHQKAFRAGINYRSQWNSISNVDGYNTAAAFIDAPVISAGNNSWIGLGLAVSSDKAGINALSNSGVMGSVAAHLQLSKTSVFSVGFQAGIINRRFDTDNLLFEEQINIAGSNTPFNNSVNNGLFADNTNINHSDLNIGLKYYSGFKNGSNLVVGGAVRHIATMNNFTETENLPFLVTLHGRVDMVINNQLSILPQVIYYQSDNASQINIQALARVKMGKTNSNFAINGGLGYRAIGNDALLAIVQLDFTTYKVGFSYDMNISDLATASNNRGGFELSFIYLAGDKKNFNDRVGCPTF